MPIERNLAEIGDLIANTVNTTITQLADGWQLNDALAFFPLIMQIPAAVKDNTQAWAYLEVITDDEETDLVNYIQSKVPNASQKVKDFIKWLTRALIADYMAVKSAMALGDEPKKAV